MKTAKLMGVGPTVSKDITRMLDNPTDQDGQKLPHKTLHNKKGIMAAYMMHGTTGARLAAVHMIEDKISENMKDRYAHMGDYGEVLEMMITKKMLGLVGKTFHRPSIYHP